MGTWGDGSFQNDAALDWLGNLEKAKKPAALIQKAFQTAIKDTDDLCGIEAAIAAAEVEAAIRGHAARGLPANLIDWIKDRPRRASESRQDLAIRCLSQVLKESELREACGNDPAWRARIKRLIKRLQQPAKSLPDTGKKKTALTKKTARAKKTDSTKKTENAPSTKTALATIKKKGAEVLSENRKPYSIYGAKKTDEEYIEAISQLTMIMDLSVEVNSRVNIKNFDQLKALDNLESVSLGNVCDEQIQFCQELKKLKHVSIRGSQVGDKGIAALASCGKIRQLSLENTNVTNRGIKQLVGLKHLEEISLFNTKVTDGIVPVLAQFPKLKFVYLQQANIKGRKFEAISKLKKLFRLELRGSNITDRELKYLNNPELVTLDLTETRITGSGLTTLKKHPKLRRLIARGSDFSDAGCQLLQGSSVSELDIRDTKITDKALPFLAKCKKLKQLNVARNRISAKALEELRNSKAIRSISYYK